MNTFRAIIFKLFKENFKASFMKIIKSHKKKISYKKFFKITFFIY